MTFFDFVFSGFAIWGAVVAAILIACVYADNHDFYQKGSKASQFRYVAVLLAAVVFLSTQHGEINFDWSLLTYCGLYLLAGLGYSLVEVVFTIDKAKTFWTLLWQDALKMHIIDIEKPDLDKDRLIPLDKEYATGKINETQYRSELFIRNDGSKSFGFVGISKSTDGGVEPQIIMGILLGYVADWALFWPFYAINLVFGRVWNLIGDFFRSFAKYTTKLIFGNVFKL